MNSKWSLRIIRWESNGPLQMNLICVNCHYVICANDVYSMMHQVQGHKCPTVLHLESLPDGNLDIQKLLAVIGGPLK